VEKKQENILILTYWSYSDALVQTYSLPYARIISDIISDDSNIYFFTLEKEANTTIKNEKKISFLNIQYKKFGLGALLMWLKLILRLSILIKKKKITTIHAWCTPAGMIGYVLSILTGKRLIIDSYEPHAEAMVENGSWKKGSNAFKILFLFEKLQTKRAQFLIAAADGMKEYAANKYKHNKNNFFTKPACVNLELFSSKNKKQKHLLDKLNLQDKIVCVYAGKFGGIYLDDEVFSFFKSAEEYWGDKFRALVLSSHPADEIQLKAEKANLNPATIIHLFVPHSEIPDYMGLADFAITPVKPVPTKKYCTPIKDGEYWALGLPVVITNNISDDTEIIRQNKIGSVLDRFDKEHYLKSIIEIEQLLSLNNNLYQKIRQIAITYRNFDIAKKIYQKIYVTDK
jgi:hypothetical protein